MTYSDARATQRATYAAKEKENSFLEESYWSVSH